MEHAELIQRCIVFDLDGTLVDSIPTVLKVLREMPGSSLHGISNTQGRQLVEPLMSEGGHKLMQTFIQSEDEVESLKLFRRMYLDINLEGEALMEGVQDTLNTLRVRGVKLGILTNKPRSLAVKVLTHHQILSNFDVVVTSSEVRAKPAPDGLLQIKTALNLFVPGLLVGDSLLDKKCAGEAHWNFAHFTKGYEKINLSSSDIAINSIRKVLSYYE